VDPQPRLVRFLRSYSPLLKIRAFQFSCHRLLVRLPTIVKYPTRESGLTKSRWGSGRHRQSKTELNADRRISASGMHPAIRDFLVSRAPGTRKEDLEADFPAHCALDLRGLISCVHVESVELRRRYFASV